MTKYSGLLIKYPLHDDFTRDWRYSCEPEYCGHSVPMLAVRFCGELIGVCRDEEKANHVMTEHQKGRWKNDN